ncbi:hypothetical protein DJ71_08115 [Halorubrum sp. E3]|uniref:hypothetical protein n=1 Tax=Halorubrum distributum TaxID=29283 RepID=UPI000BD397EC|nr:hypothetical protein [Halorubrum terrestre]OYR79530.1 hypothetical protein DJ72_13930 [Halorubrum distributum]OYR85051.1 hypothetical protein DJ71_08115 [Halorubrum sp. E3]
MKRTHKEGGTLNKYGKQQEWQKKPSDEEMEDLLEELVGDSEVVIEERESPLETSDDEGEEKAEMNLDSISDQDSILDSL